MLHQPRTIAEIRTQLLRGVARVVLSEGGPFLYLLARRRMRGPDTELDPQIAAILEMQRLLRLPSIETMSPAAARKFAAGGLAALDVLPEPMTKISDETVIGPRGPIAIRTYVPHEAGPHSIVYFHGGGGVIGSIESSEPLTRFIAAQTRCTVTSVGYRLSPEHRHPAAIEDARAAFETLAARVPERGRIAVAGESFGGFLAAHVDRAASKRRPDLQVLICPLVDQTQTSPSINRHAEGYLLTRSMMRWFRSQYLRPTDDPRAMSPLFWADHRGAAPALVVTAGYDPLIDEGNRYVDLLRAAGTPVRHRRHPSLVHGFSSLGGAVRAARTALDQTCADIRELLEPASRAH